MDPEILRQGVAMCPICNMELVPFEGSSAGSAQSGVLSLTNQQVQQSGVRLGVVQQRDLAREIDASGTLEIIPERRSALHIGYPGVSIVQSINVGRAGSNVGAGTIVLTVSNQVMLTKLQVYKALRAEYSDLRRQRKTAEAQVLLNRAGELTSEIISYGLPAPTLDKIAARPPSSEIITFPVYAHTWGIVLSAPPLSLGAALPQNQLILETANLTELWLSIDLFEHERPFVAVGQSIQFSTLALPDQTFQSTIEFIEPVVQARSQTVRAVALVSNPTMALSPGMFVRSRLVSDIPGALCVPESAVLQSGRRDVVLVAEGNGRFRPRVVTLGRRHLSLANKGSGQSSVDDEERYHEILAGLEAGEDVVISGNFLLNAEAQFQGILKKMAAAHDAQELAEPISPEAHLLIDAAMVQYFTLGRALVQDDARNLGETARALAATTANLHDEPGVGERLRGLHTTSLLFAASADKAQIDWDELRTHYATLSQGIVNTLAKHLPGAVGSGELHVFSCPMADPFGYELWVQADAELQNPYMGQRMANCGSPAELP
ncbi:MAG: Cu(I)/Ag(I) efflux system membrane fusion protein [Pseudohongiellaceae bacterium]|jgi:Cu(I)/Ag(I) efflux system membrane fusion protein